MIYGLECGTCLCQYDVLPGYQICLDLAAGLTGWFEDRAVYTRARDRWQRIIVGDVPEKNVQLTDFPTECAAGNYPYPVDDVYICVDDKPLNHPDPKIDIFALSGPVWSRMGTKIPVISTIVSV